MSHHRGMAQDGLTSANFKNGMKSEAPSGDTLERGLTSANLQTALQPTSIPAPAPPVDASVGSVSNDSKSNS
jgi:hypothetical protein